MVWTCAVIFVIGIAYEALKWLRWRLEILDSASPQAEVATKYATFGVSPTMSAPIAPISPTNSGHLINRKPERKGEKRRLAATDSASSQVPTSSRHSSSACKSLSATCSCWSDSAFFSSPTPDERSPRNSCVSLDMAALAGVHDLLRLAGTCRHPWSGSRLLLLRGQAGRHCSDGSLEFRSMA